MFAGIGRYDLLFEDQFKNNILMELKAVTAKLDVAEQLVKYKNALEEKGEKHLIMWLIAPLVPKHVGEFLDRFGVEHTEIHEAEFRQVASRCGYSFASESSQTAPVATETGQSKLRPVDATQSFRSTPGKPPSSPGRETAWYYWSGQDGIKYFLAFVNAKGSCSIRSFDADTGKALGKKYAPGDFQMAFRDYVLSGTALSVIPQVNLEKEC